MIFIDSNLCPKTKEEALRLEEQIVYFKYHLEIVKQAIDILQTNYFNKPFDYIMKNADEQKGIIISYKSVQLQIETAATLIDDCMEFIAALCGEENVYTMQTDITVSSRNKIRELLREE